ncbi:MAG: acyl-CoA dehydrogenase family protein [Actinomycetota bacterium]
MDFAWPDELLRLKTEAEEFAEEAARQVEIREDSWIIGHSHEFNKQLAERGWIGHTWPVEHGGGGGTQLERFVISEALIAKGAPIAGAWFPDRQIGPVLLQYGTPEQIERWVPEIVAGEASWCIGMSEPDAGSDVANIRTRAMLDGDDFVVSGQKIWTSGAALSDWCYLICRTDPDAPPHTGLSELIVDMTSPGVTVKPIKDASGNEHFCEIFFEDVRVPKAHLVGDMNNAFRQTMKQLEHERGGIDRLVSNRALYEHVLPLADTDDPRIRQQIAKLETGYRVGRHLVLLAVLEQAQPGFSAVTKTVCTEFEQDVATFAGSVAGAEALLWNRIGRGLVYAPAYTIMGGTTLILRNIIGERMLGLPREPSAR